MTTHYADALIQRLIAQGLTVDRKHPATPNVRARWLIQASGTPTFATSSEANGHIHNLVPASPVR